MSQSDDYIVNLQTRVAEKKAARRRKILKTIPRGLLETLSDRSRPHLADRESLEADIIANWNDDIATILIAHLTTELS